MCRRIGELFCSVGTLVRSDGWSGGDDRRFATKIGWDGGSREWAAAGGSGTGVLGLHVPSKGKGVPKKRPAPDTGRPPKAKSAKTSKSDARKGPGDPAGGEREKTGEDSGIHGERDGAPNGEEAVAGRKGGVKRPKKGGPNPAASTSPRGSAGLDLNVQEADTPVPDGKGSRGGKKGSPGVGRAGAPRTSQKTEKEKSWRKAAAQSGQARGAEADLGRGAGPGRPGGGSSVGRELNGGSSRGNPSGARGTDSNGSSDDDVTIVGVSAGNRSGASEFPAAGPPGRSKMSRHATERSETAGPARTKVAEYRGEVEELRFPAARSSGAGYGALQNEDSSLASHLMSRLSSCAGPDLLGLGVPDGVSQVQWPPAGGAWAPVPSLNELEFGADLPSPSFSEGRQRSGGAGSPSRRSPPGREAGRGAGKGSPASVGWLPASDGATRAGSRQAEPGGQAPAWMLEGRHRGGPNSHSQVSARSSAGGGSDLSRAVLRLGPPSPMGAASASGAGLLQEPHSRAHEPPRRGLAGASQSGSRPPSLGPQVHQAGAFPGVASQASSGPESAVETGLALSLGSGAHPKAAGPRAGRDAQAQPSRGP